MKTGDLTKAFGVSDETIRRWVAEFGVFLSDGAKATNARQKAFDADDYLVLATVKQLSADGNSMKAIKERLAEGYRVEDVNPATIGYEDGRLIPAAAVEQIINSSELAIQLEQVKAERDKLLDMMAATQARLEQVEAQAREREGELQQEVRALTAQMSDLQRALGKAEGELELRREQEGKKRGWFG